MNLRFDGPVVTGGSAYDIGQVVQAPASHRMPTGVRLLDELTGGIERGALWAITGAPGTGVTSLACTIAAHVAAGGAGVIVCNGHVPTRAVARALTALAARNPSPGGGARLQVASWYVMLHDPDRRGGLGIESSDLLVADTWDETWHAAPWPRTPGDLIRQVRWLRDVAREEGRSMLLTARTADSRGQDALGWMADALDDAADVLTELTWTHEGVRARVRCRGYRSGQGRLRLGTDGHTSVTPG